MITASCELIHRKGDTRFIAKAEIAADMIKKMLQQTRAFCLFTDWGQKQAEDQELFNQPLSLADMLEKALFVIGDKARLKSIEVEIDESLHKETMILAEPLTLLHSVLCNVLSNAIKFSPQCSQLKISQVQREGMIGLAVRDFGEGMSATKVQELMTSRNRVSSELGTFQEAGTGYGIIQVRHYLNKYGGDLEIRSWEPGNSNPPSGTEVTMWLRKVDSFQQAA